MNTEELRVYNYIGFKGDAGLYQFECHAGWERIFASKEDEIKYQKEFLEDIKGKPAIWHDERLVRISGGARRGERYRESKIKGIPLTEEWLLKLPEGLIFPDWIKFVHEIQNWYYWNNNKKELEFK